MFTHTTFTYCPQKSQLMNLQLNTLHFERQRNRLTFVSFMCTINFVFTLLGYVLCTGIMSAFIPPTLMESTQITIPIRVFLLSISLIALIVGRTKNAKFDTITIIYLIFWILYIIRIFVDLHLRSPSSFNPFFAYQLGIPGFTLRSWSYVLAINLFPLFSIYRSWEQIDFERAIDFILIFGTLAIISSMRTISSEGYSLYGEDATQRVEATALLGTIELGHMCASIFLLSIFRFFYSPITSIWKPISAVITIMSFVILLRSGSRGPFISILFVFVFWVASIGRNLFLIGTLSVILLGLVYALREKILDLVGLVSPVLADRLAITVKYGEGSGREYGYIAFLKESLNNWLTGFQCDMLGYAHNVFIDGFMMFGWIVGWIVPVVLLYALLRSYKLLTIRSKISWVALLYMQSFMHLQFSSCLGYNSVIHMTLFLIFLLYMKYDNKSHLQI